MFSLINTDISFFLLVLVDLLDWSVSSTNLMHLVKKSHYTEQWTNTKTKYCVLGM